MTKKAPYTWHQKEYWLGWYQERSFEQIGKPYIDQVYKPGVIGRLVLITCAAAMLALIIAIFLGAGFLLEMIL